MTKLSQTGQSGWQIIYEFPHLQSIMSVIAIIIIHLTIVERAVGSSDTNFFSLSGNGNEENKYKTNHYSAKPLDLTTANNNSLLLCEINQKTAGKRKL